jgi:parallel beta-helix repeat protein
MDNPPDSSRITRRIALGTLAAAGAMAFPANRSYATVTNKAINASSYGVVADGTTNDAPALASAIAAMSSGCVLVLPAGTMALGSAGWVGILFGDLSHIWIQGNNTAITWLATPSQQTGPIGATGLRLYNCTNAVVSGIRINGNGIGCIGLGLDTCTSCVVSQVEAFGHGAPGQFATCKGNGNRWSYCSAHDSTLGSGSRGYLLGNANSGWGETNLTIEKCSAQNNSATGFAIEGIRIMCVNNLSENNAGAGFTSSTATGSSSSDHLFFGNIGRQNLFHGWQADVYGANATRIVLTGNNFSDNTEAGIYCSKATDVVITDNILSNNGSATGAAAIVLYESNNVTISNNTIEGDATYGVGISTAFPTNTLADIVIANNRWVGSNSKVIWLETIDGSSSLRRFVVTGNIVHGGSYGLYLRTSAAGGVIDTLTISNNIVDSGTSASYFFYDTYVGQSTNVRLTGNAGGAATFNGNLIASVNSGNAWNGTFGHAASAPAIGAWVQGAIIYNSAPSAGGAIGWVCTTSGTPGIWKTFGTINL